MLTLPHTHAPNTTVPESTGYRVTNSAIRMREYGIITFNVCSKQVQKDASLEGEEGQTCGSKLDRRSTNEAHFLLEFILCCSRRRGAK